MAESNELLQFLRTVDRDVIMHLPNDANVKCVRTNQTTAVQILDENMALNNSCTSQNTSEAINDISKKSRLVKPEHVCSVCNKAFKRRDHLKEHFLIHTGERPHSCHICQKSFKRRSSLTAHFMTHQDIRPYVCSICNKSFKTGSKLNVHRRSHPPEVQNKTKIITQNKKSGNEHECNECKLKFTSSHDLNSHYKIHNSKSVTRNSQVQSRYTNKYDSATIYNDLEEHSNSAHHMLEDDFQKSALSDALKMQENEDASNGDYEEWSKHFHTGADDSDNEEDMYVAEENFFYKDTDEGVAVQYQDECSKARNTVVGYSLHRTKILNFPDY